MRAIILFVVLCAYSAWADVVEVELVNPKIMKGKGMPGLRIIVREPIAGYHLELKRSDGQPLNFKTAQKPGTARVIDLESPVGAFKWTGTLTVDAKNGTAETLPLELETEIVGPLTLKIDKDKDIDLVKRTVTFRATNPVKKAHLSVRMDTGDLAIDKDIEFAEEPAGTPLTVSWPDAAGKPLQISLKVFDTASYFIGIDFFPWAIEIPHEEVVFDTGKFDVRADQTPKVDASAKLIADAVQKFGRFAEVKLYVAGHTDTVGSTESNRTLSLNRARSIAQAFRKRGLRIPIFYEGFGEEALAVVTADETDELKNRRAQYFVAIEQPSVVNATRQPTWQSLR